MKNEFEAFVFNAPQLSSSWLVCVCFERVCVSNVQLKTTGEEKEHEELSEKKVSLRF